MTQFSQPIGHIDERPWGRYKILDQGDDFQVKRIEVESGKRLSLQSHQYRKEFWLIIKGKFEIEIDDKKDFYEPGDLIYIPIGSKHRPTCVSEEVGIFIEVQHGENLREDDIIRYQDDYGRK